MAGILFVHASDTGDLSTATEALKARIVGADLELSSHIGLGTDVVLCPATDFASVARAALTRSASGKGFIEDIVDDPALAADPKRLEFKEPVSGAPGSWVVYGATGTSNKLEFSSATMSDLVDPASGALTLLGL